MLRNGELKSSQRLFTLLFDLTHIYIFANIAGLVTILRQFFDGTLATFFNESCRFISLI